MGFLRAETKKKMLGFVALTVKSKGMYIRQIERAGCIGSAFPRCNRDSITLNSDGEKSA